ncbi:alpha/beta fold hydrolase [Pseudonocardia hispaniensis]|uniref:Alpha/beta fold hydrolase n=2 Tax=Pseudonocardia hispaniensis TaxID=904933 RepID=A0ABW1J0L5_9PSEU
MERARTDGCVEWALLPVMEALTLSKTVVCKPLTEWKSVATELLGTQTRFVQGKRWRHRVIECGDGEPLILIHGIGGHAETYARNLHNLAANGFHVYAVDALYHGFTDKQPYSDERRWDLQVDALADLIEGLGYSWAHIEGESMGAMITFEFGMRYPQMCGKLIMNTGFGAVDLKKTDFRTQPGGGVALQELSVQSVVNPTFETVRKRMEWLVASPDRMTDEMVEIRLRLYSFPEIYRSMQNVYWIGKQWRWTPRWEEEDVAKFQPEALVFWTEHNPGQGPDYGEYVAGLIPGAKFYTMADAAHWPQWEKPEEHDQVLIDFIQGGR